MNRQLAFDIPPLSALRRADFFASPANAEALAVIEDWPRWPNGRMLLVGPEGTGKTHLAHIWADQTGAEAVAATAGEVQGMLEHVEQALLALEVLDPSAPRKLLPRLQRLASRAELTRDEVQILRGVCTAILRKVPPG